MIRADKMGGGLIQDLGFAGKTGQKNQRARGLVMLQKQVQSDG